MRVISPLGQVLVFLLVLSFIAPPARTERANSSFRFSANEGVLFGLSVYF